MSRKYRRSVFMLAMAIALLLVTAAQAAPVTVKFPVRAGEGPYWQEVAKQFNAQSDDVKVEAEMLSGNWFDYIEKIQVMVSSGVSPDMVYIPVILLSPFRYTDMLADLTPYLDRSGLSPDDYFPGVINFFRENGKVDLLPIGMNTTTSIINEDLFSSRGMPLPSRDWQKSWTWDDFEAGVKRLTVVDNGKFKSKAYEIYDAPTTWLPFVWGNGGRWLDTSTDVPTFALDEDPAVEALAFLRDVFQTQDTILGDNVNAEADFRVGNVAARLTATWWVKEGREMPESSGIYPLPRGKRGPVTSIATNPVGLLKTAKHPDAAWKFIEWLHTKEGSEYFVQSGAFGVPVYRKAAEWHADEIFGFRPRADAAVILDSMHYLRMDGIGPAVYDIYKIARSGFTNMVNNEVSLTQFLQQAEQETNITLREAYSEIK